LHRFFVPPESLHDGELILRNAQARQIREVLRLRAGDLIVALDNSGAEYHVELTEVGRAAVRGRWVEKIVVAREPRTRVILYQSLLKADKFEWVLQKCTEVGVAEFAPMTTARTVADSISRTKQARWERILIEAAEQAARSKIPILHPLRTLADALKEARARGGPALLPWEQERANDLHAALGPGEPVHLFIGPEGGFEADEAELARAYGATPITLGPRILRAETAGLVTTSAILYARGEMDAADI
jgi:16S rRNA (uracil1498-N3)-methyltransferase